MDAGGEGSVVGGAGGGPYIGLYIDEDTVLSVAYEGDGSKEWAGDGSDSRGVVTGSDPLNTSPTLLKALSMLGNLAAGTGVMSLVLRASSLRKSSEVDRPRLSLLLPPETSRTPESTETFPAGEGGASGAVLASSGSPRGPPGLKSTGASCGALFL